MKSSNREIHVASLSRRQCELLRLLAAGDTDKEAARQLGVSVNTVRTYLKRLYAAYGFRNRTQAVASLLFSLDNQPRGHEGSLIDLSLGHAENEHK